MKIFVTGGLGFIGSNFIKYVLDNFPEDKIINFDKPTYCGNPENLKDVEKNPRYKYFPGDICDFEAVKKAMNGSDKVVHFAAQSHVDRSIKDPFSFTQTNVMGTNVMLEAAKENNIKIFLHISTDEIYGSIEKGEFNEKDPTQPNNPYSASKVGAEALVRSYNKTMGLPTIITRSSNNFGPFQFPEKLIPLFITNLLEDKKVPVYGEGNNRRDWLYVEDNCAGIKFVLDHGKEGEIYNIGGGNDISNMEITKKILEYLGKDESYIEHVKDRPGHDFRYALDCTKINQLGWKPKLEFEEALKKTIDWYNENKEWWLKLKSRVNNR
jgi:dTDP-glucose 4,6-dehydratase